MARPKRPPIHPRLAEYRQSAGLTQEQVAEKVGITAEMVRRHEHGVSLPSPVYRQRYCALYGVDVHRLGLAPHTGTLRGARVARGWTVPEVATRLRKLSPARLPDDLDVSYQRWEEGQEAPNPFYLRLLTQLFAHPITFASAEPVTPLAGQEPAEPVHGRQPEAAHTANAERAPTMPTPQLALEDAADDQGETDTTSERPRAALWVRRARIAKGWTSAKLNRELRRLASERGVGAASAQSLRIMISQWENGHQQPSEHYERLLLDVLGVDAAPRKIGNGLRDAREQMGWSQSEVATLLRHAADTTGVKLPREILNQYKRWESGRCRPSPFYLDLLVRVFGPIDGLEPIKGNPRVLARDRDQASGTTPEPAAELVAALLRVLESGANLVIGIAPSDVLSTAIHRQAELDSSTGARAGQLVIDQAPAPTIRPAVGSMLVAS